jgi:hypothetical protein
MRHLLVCATLVFLTAACSTGSTPKASGAAGSSGSGSGGAAAGPSGGAGGPGSAGTGAAGTGAAGTSAGTAGGGGSSAAVSGGGGSTGTAGAGGTGTGNPDASPITDGNVGDFPHSDCAAGAIFCDGFEQYPIKPNPFDPMLHIYDLIAIGDTAPTWLSYHFHGPPRVDATKPFKGKQSYHLDTESGHIVAADIIKEAPDGTDLLPAANYGRVMVWLKNIPPKSAWGLMTESGLLAGSTTTTAQYTLGGANGKLAFQYMQRKRIVKNDVSNPTVRRGGDAQNADPAPQVSCQINATTEMFPPGKWVCVEWMMNRTKPEMHMWLDGQAQTEVDVSGTAGTCAIGMATTWQGPEHFTELVLGWEVYGNDAGSWEAWFDEFAVGTQRLGCPMP